MAKYYMADLFDFFGEVRDNNDRAWFACHKERYLDLRAQWLADVDRLIAAMTAFEPALAGQTAKSCAYRFYRDTRFSTDKSPFKTYFSAAFTDRGRKAVRAGYYLQTGLPGEYTDTGIYAGIWCPDAPLLKRLRKDIVDNVDEFRGIVESPEMTAVFPQWAGETLKTMPKGWDRNHPDADLLRRKDYGRFAPLSRKFFLDPSWPEKTAEMFAAAAPMVRFLNYSIDNPE